MSLATNMTLLAIDGIELSPWSVRDLTMTLEPIGQAFQQVRNVNGTLLDISESQFHGKYKATIVASDHESPVFVGVLPGTIVQVTCVPFLGLNRNSEDVGEQLVLTMMVQPWAVSRREWASQTSWQLQLESV